MMERKQGRIPREMGWRFFVAVVTTLPLLWSVVEGQSQYFVEEPTNLVVNEGSTARFKCVIGNRKGAVQWAKDGFSLGFNHSIPGFDRYRIMSSHENEFDLMIVSTQLSDDAEYACQVLPGGGDGRLQAKATLTVNVPCQPPMIINYNNGSVVEVPYRQRDVSLTCKSRLGRPAATIEWYEDGIKVTNGVTSSVEPYHGDKRETSISTLTITLNQHHPNVHNGRKYECRATNDAIVGPPMSTHVTLSVMYPPGPPEISGYPSNRKVKANDTLVLICQSKGGHPLGTVTWYRNTQPVDRSFKSEQDSHEGVSTNVYTFTVRPSDNHAIYSNKWVAGLPESFLRMGVSTNVYTFTVRPSDNHAIYRCEVLNLVTPQPLTAQYNLTVYFPPTSVTMTGPEEPVAAGSQVTFSCETSNSNPKANITWFAKDRPIYSRVTETVRASPDGGFITTSEVTVPVGNQDHRTVYDCRATNTEFPQTVEDSRTLSVMYPPGAPEITGYNEGNTVRAGHLERMTCISVGGNPGATLEWYKGSRKIRSSPKIIGHISSSEVAIVLEASDNGAVYTCKASNEATNTPLEASITLTVQFPPTHVFITASTTEPKAGEAMNLTCVCSSSNPAAEITWIRNGRRMLGLDLGSVNAENGGKNTTSRLQIMPTSRDHGAIYGCRATNRVLAQSQTDAVTLNVKFKPDFDHMTGMDMDPVDATQNEQLVVNLTAYANPPASNYILLKEGADFDNGRFAMSAQGILTISSVEKEDKGSYTVKAVNTMGAAMFNFTINVKYRAEIVDISSRQTKNEGETAIFTCKVDANPMVPNLVTWSRKNDDGFDMSRTSTRMEGDTSYLTIPDVTKTDAGKFKCVADNMINTPASRTTTLVVNFAPTIDKSKETSRSAGEMGSTINLVCRSDKAPNIRWTWTRNNNELDDYSKYRTRERDSDRWSKSTLTISDLQAEDYGRYVCTASNSEGSDSHSVTVSGTSKPSQPTLIRRNNVTSSTINISWNPGFDGGLAQSFRVRYKPTNARGYMYVDVRPYGTTTYKITGLELGTEYEITVLAFNEKGESSYMARGITVSTSDTLSPSDIATSSFQESDELPVIIILVVCIVGVFILTLNIGLILFFIRRRKKRLENGTSDTTSHTNTFELYGNSHKGDNSIYPPPSDDTRSYGTYDYDKSYDDFSDDYIQNTDSFNTPFQQYSQVVRELETFVAPPKLYGAVRLASTSPTTSLKPLKDYDRPNRPYSPPHKIMESPRMGGRKQTYIDDNISIGRNSPWNEVSSYKVAPPPRYGTSNGDIYDYKSNKNVGMNELSDRPSSRPSSRTGKTPPPPPPLRSNASSFNTPIPNDPYHPHHHQHHHHHHPNQKGQNTSTTTPTPPPPSFISSSSTSSFTPCPSSSFSAAAKIAQADDNNGSGCGKPPPPPLPSRNYSPQEVTSSSCHDYDTPNDINHHHHHHLPPPQQPRYVTMPGSSSVLSPNIVANPNYNGPPAPPPRTPSPNDTLPAGSEFRGHLV